MIFAHAGPPGGVFKTRVLTEGSEATVSISYKHSRVKLYLKEGRAIRVETTINGPRDVGVLRRIEHLEELREVARSVNRRLLDVQRVASGPDLAASLFEQVAPRERGRGEQVIVLVRDVRPPPIEEGPGVRAVLLPSAPALVHLRPADTVLVAVGSQPLLQAVDQAVRLDAVERDVAAVARRSGQDVQVASQHQVFPVLSMVEDRRQLRQ